jgi:hypothetical protein
VEPVGAVLRSAQAKGKSMPVVVFFPIGNGDTTLVVLADGRAVLIDYADMRNPNNPDDPCCDLPKALLAELPNKEKIEVVCFSHLDKDHVNKASEFFYLEHAAKYQGEGRVKIGEMWVPAGALTEKEIDFEDARLIRREARHRLKAGKGIRIFSKPESMATLLASWGLTLEERKHCFVDAGTCIPGFSTTGLERAEFFVHSPFAWRQDDRGYEERNADSAMFQVTFVEGGRESYALFGADVDCDTLSQIVQTTKKHQNEDRLRWDLLKLFHHCSYTALSKDKGIDETMPVEDVKWLFETQGRSGCVIVSPSEPISAPGTPEDKDIQPPHREAANYYKKVVKGKNGEFKVTGETPNKTRPKPLKVEITWRGVRVVVTLTTAIGTATTSQARSG